MELFGLIDLLDKFMYNSIFKMLVQNGKWSCKKVEYIDGESLEYLILETELLDQSIRQWVSKKTQSQIKAYDIYCRMGKIDKFPIGEYLRKLALIDKEFIEKGPSEALFARADSLNRISPVRSYIDVRRYFGK